MKNLKKLFLILILLILKGTNNEKYYFIFNKFIDNQTVQLINANLTEEQYKIKGLNFLNKIKTTKLNNIKQHINNIKISVIIPIYNCQNTIELTLKSIHFQSLNEIEIILVNDKSTDNSSYILDYFQSFDKRINIINNQKNMGTLYSRCIGVLNSKGEYVVALDNDDLFLFEEFLETLYYISKINYFDIVEIKSFNIPNYKPKYEEIVNGDFIFHQNNLILHQPELSSFSISENDKLNLTDHFVWGKSIRSKIYKKAINKLGKEKYYTYNCWTEDITIIFIIFNIAKSFIFLNIFGVFHLKDISTTTNKLNNTHKLLSHIFYLGILFDFSKNDSKTKNLVAEYTLSFSLNDLKELDEKNKRIFKSIIKKLNECKYISYEYKQKLLSLNDSF